MAARIGAIPSLQLRGGVSLQEGNRRGFLDLSRL